MYTVIIMKDYLGSPIRRLSHLEQRSRLDTECTSLFLVDLLGGKT